MSNQYKCDNKFIWILYYAKSFFVLWICNHKKVNNLMTSEPSPREVVVKLLMRSSNEKNQDARGGNAPLVAACKTKISVRHDGGGGVVLTSFVITTAAEGSFWPILLLRRRQRGRFGILYYFCGGGEVVLAYSILPTATAESAR